MEQMKKIESNEDKWVRDSSVDHKGRVPLRASTGAWKASVFIIAIEFGERLTYFAIVASLIIYLTKVINQDLKTAAKSVNYWTGVTTMMPLLGGFLADAYLGRFFTVLASSIIYLMALLLLLMSRVIPFLQPCNAGENCREPRKVHEIIFFLALYLISIGTGGYRPCLESFGADQFDDDHPQERVQKMSFFNWWNFGLCCGMLIGVTVIVYVQDHVGWAAAYIVLTVVMTLTVTMFHSGRPLYRFRKPNGSPFTPMLQVIFAAVSKRNMSYVSDSDELYEVASSDKTRGRFLVHTDKLRFLDKAAIIRDPSEKQNPWKLATVTRVEETKLIINMIPIWLTSLPFGMCATQPYTFFTKQSMAMDRKLSPDFTIPPASVSALSAIALIAFITIYDKILVPFLRKVTGNERGISILHRIGIGMSFSILTMVVAALIEKKRLTMVEENPTKGSSTMSVFWLAPQFVIISIADAFTLVGLQEYFYDQVPDSMRSLGIAFYLSVIGVSSFASSLLITVVDHATRRLGGGGKSWFGKDLNSSRLDYFYWLLAVIAAVNLCVYVFVARKYSYKNVRKNNVRGAVVADCYEADENGLETVA